MATVLNFKHTRGIPANAVYIGRSMPNIPGNPKFHNPFKMYNESQRDEVCDKYRQHLWNQILRGEVTVADLIALSVWLHGHRESDFDWLTLHDNNNDYVFEDWNDIFQYIRENTGLVLSTHNLSQCGDACNCIKCNPSKTLCNAPCNAESETGTNVLPDAPLPRVEQFSDLPDGTLFYLAQTYAYGGRQKYQKVLEDGGLHNAVLYTESYSGMRVPDIQLVIRVGDKS